MSEEDDEQWITVVEEMRDGQDVGGRAGYMWKRGEKNESYQLRWMVVENQGDVLKPTVLAYYKDESKAKKQGVIELGKVTAISTSSPTSINGLEGKVGDSTVGYLLLVTVPGRVYELKVFTELARDRWAHMLRALCFGTLEAWKEPAPRITEWDWMRVVEYRQPLILEIKVVRAVPRAEDHGGGTYTAYLVEVSTNASFMFGNNTKWVIFKRYTDFVTLRTSIISFFPNPELPHIPARDWSGRFSPSIIEYRRQHFQVLLDDVLARLPSLTSLPLALRDWLSPSRVHQSRGEVSMVLSMDDQLVGAAKPSDGDVSLPGELRFSVLVGYAARMAALKPFLDQKDWKIPATLARAILRSVAQLNPSHRVEVARALFSHLEDPDRFFLLWEDLPSHLISETTAT